MGYVYLIYDYYNGYYKIGVTKNVERRLKQLQTGNPTELELISSFKSRYPFKVETILHGRYQWENVLNEWFCIDSKIRETFVEECQRAENIVTALKDNPFFFKKKPMY